MPDRTALNCFKSTEYIWAIFVLLGECWWWSCRFSPYVPLSWGPIKIARDWSSHISGARCSSIQVRWTREIFRESPLNLGVVRQTLYLSKRPVGIARCWPSSVTYSLVRILGLLLWTGLRAQLTVIVDPWNYLRWWSSSSVTVNPYWVISARWRWWSAWTDRCWQVAQDISTCGCIFISVAVTATRARKSPACGCTLEGKGKFHETNMLRNGLGVKGEHSRIFTIMRFTLVKCLLQYPESDVLSNFRIRLDQRYSI